MLRPMTTELPAPLRAVFQPSPDAPIKAALVAGACGNVGFGKAGQFLRLLSKHDVPVIALDLSPSVQEVPDKLRASFAKKFSPEQIDAMLAKLVVVQGTLADVPAELGLGFVFEAIPERLDIKRPFYEAIRARDPEAYVFSATSGITTQKLFAGIGPIVRGECLTMRKRWTRLVSEDKCVGGLGKYMYSALEELAKCSAEGKKAMMDEVCTAWGVRKGNLLETRSEGSARGHQRRGGGRGRGQETAAAAAAATPAAAAAPAPAAAAPAPDDDDSASA